MAPPNNGTIFDDGCFPVHDPTKSYCSEFKGRKAIYPRFPSLDDLLPIDDMALKLGVKRKYLADARYEDPPLPYLRFGRRIMISLTQLVWWLNEKQDTKPDPYFLARKRRRAEGKNTGSEGRGFMRRVPKNTEPSSQSPTRSTKDRPKAT